MRRCLKRFTSGTSSSRLDWVNAWTGGIFTFHHYYSTTHEVLGIHKGTTTLLIGGENGKIIPVTQRDVLIIPAGVAHCNLGREHQVACVGANPNGRKSDLNTGAPHERPATDQNISLLPTPEQDQL